MAVTLTEDRFESLYRECRDDLFAYMCTFVTGSDAEDLVAQAFLKAYTRRHLFSLSRGSGRAWVFSIARNLALDELRRRKRQAVPLAEPLEGSIDTDTDARLDVLEAVRALPRAERELIALKYWADLDNAEIAKVLGISKSNVSTRLTRVLEKLRRQS